jgi:hypothetical protein
MDITDFAEKFNGNWEEMKDHIRVEYDYLDNGRREQQFIEKAKQECENFTKTYTINPLFKILNQIIQPGLETGSEE